MDKKKIFIVVVLAAMLALLSAFFVLKFVNRNIEQTQVIQDVVQEETVSVDVVEEKVEDSSDVVLEQKPVEIQQAQKPVKVVKKVVKQAEVTESPILKPLQVEEVKVVENRVEENKEDCGILKDSTTNEIVITREFKTTTPNKYSFK